MIIIMSPNLYDIRNTITFQSNITNLKQFILPIRNLNNDNRCFMKIAARGIVKRGDVNIRVTASDTGIKLIHANADSIIRLPNSPTEHKMSL